MQVETSRLPPVVLLPTTRLLTQPHSHSREVDGILPRRFHLVEKAYRLFCKKCGAFFSTFLTFLPSSHHSLLRSGVHLSSVSMILPRHSHSFFQQLVPYFARPLRANYESRERTRGRGLGCAPFLSRLTGCGKTQLMPKTWWDFRMALKPEQPQDAQKGCPARPQRAKRRGVRFSTLSL